MQSLYFDTDLKVKTYQWQWNHCY